MPEYAEMMFQTDEVFQTDVVHVSRKKNSNRREPLSEAMSSTGLIKTPAVIEEQPKEVILQTDVDSREQQKTKQHQGTAKKSEECDFTAAYVDVLKPPLLQKTAERRDIAD